MYDGKGNFIDSHHIILLLVHYLHKYKGLTGKVWERGQTIQVEDYGTWEGRNKSIASGVGLCSVVGAPLKSGDKILGVLFFPFVWIISWTFIRRSIALEDEEVEQARAGKEAR